jgi:plasmid stabilization system protein ParE
MTHRVVIQPQAERDIRTAALWILGRSGSRPTALRWVRGLRAKIATLKASAQRCPVDPDSEVYGEEVRVLHHGKRRDVYRVRRRHPMNASTRLMERAEQAAGEAQTWADLSNFLFDPDERLIARAYPTREAREAFVKTEDYRRLRRLVADTMDRHGLVPGGTPSKSGRFVVRLPRSLHAALEREAIAEGISLNPLVVAKLAVGLGRMTGLAVGEPTDDQGHSANPAGAV